MEYACGKANEAETVTYLIFPNSAISLLFGLKPDGGGIVIQLFGCLMSKFLAGPIARCACLITCLHWTYLDSKEALSAAGV